MCTVSILASPPSCSLGSMDAATSIEHRGAPGAPSVHTAEQLARVESVAAMLGDAIAPLFSFAIAWLRRNIPRDVPSISLVHGDMGPGNFLARGGGVTAVLDWEVAHWGDPMEDLAAISVRDMATPMGDLTTRFAEYREAGGAEVDLARVSWYRVLVLTRNAMLIGLGLGRDDAAVDRAQLTMYRILLMRAAALSLCDAIGMPRPVEPPLAEGAVDDDLRLAAHAWRDQRDVVVPALFQPAAVQRAVGAGAVLGYLEHRMRFGIDFHRRELDDLAAILEHQPGDDVTAWRELRDKCSAASLESSLASFFGRHLLRCGMMAAPLLGSLAPRLPQPLVRP
jgi:hypothetical protein